MSQLGKLLLISTALAPVLLVYGAAIVYKRPGMAVGLLIASALLALICHLVLSYLGRSGTSEEVDVEEVSGKDTDILAFLVAYMLPIALAEKVEVNLPAFITFLLLIGLVFFRTDVYHVNPLMGMLGYHFYQVKSRSKVTYLVVRKGGEPLTPGSLVYKRLSRSLLLACKGNH